MYSTPYAAILLLYAANATGLLHSAASVRLGNSVHRASPLWLRRACRWLFQRNFGLVLYVSRLVMVMATGSGLLPSPSDDAPLDSLTSVLIRRWSIPIFRAVFMVAERYDLNATLAVTFLVGCPAWCTVYARAGVPNGFRTALWNAGGTALPRLVLEYFWPTRPIAAADIAAVKMDDGSKQGASKGQASSALATPMTPASQSSGKNKHE